ncbi:MAG TPA: iron uptake transporter deferrochelatase/peroxidase subunit [Kineosporiaceae bacterium]|nr:iron uptake transporter deferrochelatase/peroxidase subunit [Kineosporiaceae bacterium]
MSLAGTVSRRGLLGVAGGTALAVGAGAGAGWAALRTGDGEQPASAGTPVPFHGAHQAGIASAVQDRLHMAAFDLTTERKADLVDLLKRWTAAAERMTRGLEVVEGGAAPTVADAPPDDTGEALGLPASRLTITLGLGPGLFVTGGRDRFGLRRHRPAALIDLPHFAHDALDAARGGGDLVVQACADDPQVAVHAVRNLARLAMGTATVRWSQLGFGRTSSTTPAEQTPRNLFGFKDGTNNIAGDDADALRRHVWVDAAADRAPAWIDGGSYLVMRRIAMRIESWDRTSLAEQEDVTGRHKLSGAPIGAAAEHDGVQVASLPAGSHVALAHPDANGGHRILRRGYSYVDGSDGLGKLDAGLFFLAYCRDPRAQYVPMQTRMARSDRMAEYFTHVASGLYAVPPGTQPGEYWAQRLLEA